jgi:hypothetical protein
MLVFNWPVVSTGFDRLYGHVADQRLLVFISEHWYGVLRGEHAWRSPPFFYPAEGALGYSDALVLFQPLYAPLRALGVEPLIAFQCAVMSLTTVGYASTVALLRVVGVRWGVAVAGGTAVAFANVQAVQLAHGQLSAANLVPLLLLVGVQFVRAVDADRRTRAVAFGTAGGALLGATFFTSFYVGWLFCLAVAVTAAVFVIAGGSVRTRAIAWLRDHTALLAVTSGPFLVVVALTMLPFAATYLPVLDESSGRSFTEEVLPLLPRASDIANYGDHNLMWTRDAGTTTPFEGLAAAERAIGVTPVLLGSSLLVMAVWAGARRDRTGDGERWRISLVLFVTSAVLLALSLRLGDASLWQLVSLLPGSQAIRAPGRVVLVAQVGFVLSWALVMEAGFRRTEAARPERWARVAAVGLAAVLLAVPLEQINVGMDPQLAPADQAALLASAEGVPEVCEAFFVEHPTEGRGLWVMQTDAMGIAQHLGIPTLNGYSGLAPPGWELLGLPGGAPYHEAVGSWVEGTNIEARVCAFNLRDSSWRVLDRQS